MLKSESSWVLPISAWCPYRIDNLSNYLAAYTQEIMGGVPLICLHIGVDSMFVTLVLQLCTKLEILNHRLKGVSDRYQGESAIPVEKLDEKTNEILGTYADKHERILQYVIIFK